MAASSASAKALSSASISNLESRHEPDECAENQVQNSNQVNVKKTAWCIVKGWWKHAVIISSPLLLIFIPFCFTPPDAGWAAYSIAIIAVYWVTEAIPLAVTALLPLILFPAFGVLTARATASNYLNDSNMLFAGGLMVAVCIEKWNVHKRIALLVLLLVGSKPKWLLFGFMITTAFLSMWISNTATAAMMLPIAHAVLGEIKRQSQKNVDSETSAGVTVEERHAVAGVRYARKNVEASSFDKETLTLLDNDEGSAAENNESDDQQAQKEVCNKSVEGDSENEEIVNQPSADLVSPLPPSTSNKTFSRLTKGLMLGIAYSANIGGTATLTGTGPNLVLSGDINSIFPSGPGINFGEWFLFAAPTMIVCLLVAWLYLCVLFCDDSLQWCKRKLLGHKPFLFSGQSAREVIRQQYKDLGPWRYAEVAVLICFIILAFLWLSREPKFIPGWSVIFKVDENNRSYFSDASAAMFVVILLFIIPSQFCFTIKEKRLKFRCPSRGYPTLLDWDTVHHKLPWNVILLLGSGFAIANGAEVSGLSCWIGDKLLVLQHLPRPLIVFTVTVMVAMVTEVISNVATTTLFLPVLASLAVSLETNPLYLMIPATISASFAFMLPVATPPNAIAFSYHYLKVYEMAFTGILMNLLCILIVNLSVNTVAVPIFDLHTFPNWSNSSTFNGHSCNSTSF